MCLWLWRSDEESVLFSALDDDVSLSLSLSLLAQSGNTLFCCCCCCCLGVRIITACKCSSLEQEQRRERSSHRQVCIYACAHMHRQIITRRFHEFEFTVSLNSSNNQTNKTNQNKSKNKLEKKTKAWWNACTHTHDDERLLGFLFPSIYPTWFPLSPIGRLCWRPHSAFAF